MLEELTEEDMAKFTHHMAAFECSLATCKYMHMPDSDVCEKGLPEGKPEECPSFNPEGLVRAARTSSGETYARRVAFGEYRDETLGWFKTMKEANVFIASLKDNQC